MFNAGTSKQISLIPVMKACFMLEYFIDLMLYRRERMEIPTETMNQLLPNTTPVLESNVQEKVVAGHSPRYYRVKNLLEIDDINFIF